MGWMIFIALPTTAFTSVSSAVGGIQLFNSGSGSNGAQSTTNGGRGGFEFPMKLAFFQPSPTPKPTATPKPTETPRPVVVAPRPQPTAAAPVVAIVAPKATLPPIEWDNRLGPNGIDKITYPDLEGVRIVSAPATSGQKFWRIVRVKFEGKGESSDTHNVFVKTFGEDGKRVDGKKLRTNPPMDKLEEKQASDICDCNFTVDVFTGGAPDISIDDQYPSETMVGMCLCGIKDVFRGHAHVNYRLIYQLVTMP
jgi:hypothetical protein